MKSHTRASLFSIVCWLTLVAIVAFDAIPPAAVAIAMFVATVLFVLWCCLAMAGMAGRD